MRSTRAAGQTGVMAADAAPLSAPVADREWSRSAALEALRSAFVDAAARNGTAQRTFRIAGLHVAARFAGQAMVAAVEPALAHLAVAVEGPADLTVEVWDSASTGVDVPALPERRSAAASDDSRVRSSYHVVPRILSLYDAEARTAVVWVPDATQVPSNEVASPLRTVLHWWARDNGLQFVHAGAIGSGGRAVLLAGPAGAGKSTSALAGLISGLDYLGDDYVLIDTRQGTTIHSLYSAAKLQPEQVAAFPALGPYLTNGDRLSTEKALWFVQRDFPERTRASAVACAVLVPRVSGRDQSSLTPIARSTALASLAPSTLAQLSGADQWSMRAMAVFLERLPVFQLEAGRDLADLARTVRDLLEAGA